MINRLKRGIKNRTIFALRKRVKDRIIVIESDDWGMERAPHKGAVDYAIRRFSKEKISRWTTDSLETPEDLSRLFELLYSYKHQFEQPPVITANFITQNIQAPTDQTFELLPIDQGFITQDQKTLKALYYEGLQQGFFIPQLHGFAHYHLMNLENYLRSDRAREFIEQGFPLMEATIKGNLHFLWGEMTLGNTGIAQCFKEASSTFEKMFGYKSTSFIAPHYLFDLPLIQLLREQGVRYLQGASNYSNDHGERLYYPSFRKRNGITWGMRNARLDVHPDYSYLHNQCLMSIDRSFRHGLPAIIDIHRVNFSGNITPELRDKTIQELDALFKNILKKWPDARFMSSNQLNTYLYGT